MFLPFWILLSVVGIGITVWVFAWAVSSRQFTDQRRMAALPLRDLPPEELSRPARRFSADVAVLLGILALGVGLVVFMLVIAA